MGVDIQTDDLLFFPFVYWPLVNDVVPSPEAAVRIRDYLSGGGVILFDSRDPNGAVALDTMPGAGRPAADPAAEPGAAGARAYAVLLPAARFPRPLDRRHPVDRAGRVNASTTASRRSSPAANDWAGAWAMDPAQRPLYAVVPGGERQREMAYRFGINLVMYTLTGNYKGDQVHLPAILERLGL